MKTKFDISKFTPCSLGAKYYAQFDNHKEAWEQCHRGDWMLWVACELGVDIRLLTLAKGLCANTVRHLMKDERSINAVDTAIAFGKGEIGINELNAAASAYDSDDVVYASDDVDAADAAASAAVVDATSISVSTYVAAASASASAYAASTSVSASAYAAKIQNQLETANICREILTNAVFEIIEQLNNK